MRELERFDREYTPAASGQMPGIDVLPDGEYTFTIVDASLGLTPQTKDAILRMHIQPDGKEGTYERVKFLKQQQDVDYAGGEMVTLGFDADRWKPAYNRSFSKELPSAVPRLKGIRFKGVKKTLPARNPGDKPFHTVYVNALVSSGSAAGSSAPPPDSTPADAGDQIPF